MATKKNKAVKREFAYITSYGDLAGPYSKQELIRDLTDASWTEPSEIKSTKVFKLNKVKATITPALITIAE